MNNRLSAVIVALLLAIALNPPHAGADDSARGRFPDGRAYRTDDGLRLSDYIAELEVTNDDLRRQVDALSDELESKRKQLDKVGAQPSSITERDLSAEKSALGIAKTAAPACPEKLCPTCPSCKVVDVSPYEQTISELNSKVSRLQQEIGSLERARTNDKDLYTRLESTKRERDDLQDAYDRAQEELKQTKSELQKSSAQVDKLTQDLAREKQSTELAKRQAEEERNQLNQARARLSEELTAARATATTSTNPASASAPEQVAIRRIEPQVVAKRAQPLTAHASGEQAASIRPVNSATGEFSSQLSSIQRSIIERKNLIDALKSSGKGVTVRIQPLMTKQGTSLDSLRTQIQRTPAGADTTAIRLGLNEISKILNDDITLLRRLVR